MTKPSIFNKINQSLNNLVDSSVIPESEAVESNNNALTDSQASAHQIQQLEVYLDNLVSNLQQGQLPVNLKKVTQVFDGLVTQERLPIDIPAQKFVELYNDLPNILIGYAIEATLSDETYRQTDTHLITFHRQNRGSYWIFPTDRIGKTGAAWLVPNPLKNTKLDRVKSLKFSFDLNSSGSNQSDIFILEKPALVQLLSQGDRLTWKLTDRGEIKAGIAVNSSLGVIKHNNNEPIANSIDLNQQIEQIVQARLKASQTEILKQCQEIINGSLKDLTANTRTTVPSSNQAPITAEEDIKQANQKQKNNDIAGSVGNYDLAIKRNPLYADYANVYKQTEIAYLQGNYQKAKNLADAMLDNFEIDPSVRLLRGHIYTYGLQEYEIGTKEYEYVLAITNDPEFTQLAQRGLEHIKGSLKEQVTSSNRHNYDRAIDLLDAKISSPNSIARQSEMTAKYYFNRAREKEQQHDAIGALADYNAAIDLDPNFANAYFNRGMLKKNSSLLKDTKGAIASLRTAALLYQKQGHLEIYNSLLAILKEMGA